MEKIKAMRLHVVVGVIVEAGKVLICQRPKHLAHGGQWEFPGGKIEKNEQHFDALSRELSEEVGITTIKAHHFFSTEYQYTDKYVRLECFLITKFMGKPYCKEKQPQMHWVDIESLPKYDFPEANHDLIDQLLQLVSSPALQSDVSS